MHWYKSLGVTKNKIVAVCISGKMKFYGFWLLLIAIFYITITVGRNIDYTSNAFLKSKSIACHGGRGNNGGGGTNTTSGATGAMTNMTPNLMRTAQQAMDTLTDMVSNMNPMG